MFCSHKLVIGGTAGDFRCRGRPVPFSCFALPESSSAVPSAAGPVFMFCAHKLVIGGTEGDFRCRGRPVPFSCFAPLDTLSAVSGASCPVFMFCAPGLVFRRYRDCRVPFSYFALTDSFSEVSWASGLVFMFCAPGLVFDGTEGVGSRFQVLRSRNRFRRCRVRQVPFSCFALTNSLSAVPRASGLVFMFCAPGIIFGGTEGVGSRFNVLRSQTHFRRYLRRLVPFSCFAPPKSFSAVARASGSVFRFCAPGLVFDDIVGVGSRFHVARPDSFSTVARASGPVYMFCTPGLVFGRSEGVGSRLHVLRSRDRFRRY
jgi:hypothetical protein